MRDGMLHLRVEPKQMSFLRALAGLTLAAAATACMINVPQQPGPDFYVMRHLHKAEGSADPGLSAEGQRQAQLLAERFGARPPAVIYVTNTRRARENGRANRGATGAGAARL
jgi:hypothetical protein